jgi:hypothetical protein
MKVKKIDMSILDDLIGKCEKSMVSPLKKEIVIAGTSGDEMEDEEEGIDDEMLEALMEKYRKIKGK